jgi:hypothetical protein
MKEICSYDRVEAPYVCYAEESHMHRTTNIYPEAHTPSRVLINQL